MQDIAAHQTLETMAKLQRAFERPGAVQVIVKSSPWSLFKQS